MNQPFRQNMNQRGPAVERKPAKPHVTLTEENYVDLAEQAIDDLIEISKDSRGKVQVVTTSKIRNLLSTTSDIYNEVVNLQDETLPRDILGRVGYLRVRFVYESGREQKVRNLVETADILKHLADVKTSRKQFLLFSRYMESLVAFRKYKVNDKDD